jgi:hypothetical protein
MDNENNSGSLQMQSTNGALGASCGDKQEGGDSPGMAKHGAGYRWTGAWRFQYVVVCPCGFIVRNVKRLSEAIAIRDAHNAQD